MTLPPKKRGACSTHAPNSTLTPATTSALSGKAQHYVCDPAPLVCTAQTWCPHLITRIELANGVHHAKEVCAGCGRVLRWLPKPATIERQKLTAFRLVKLAMRPDLTDWERNFVRSVSQRRKLSPKQQQIIDRLVTRYLEGAS